MHIAHFYKSKQRCVIDAVHGMVQYDNTWHTIASYMTLYNSTRYDTIH